MAAHLEECELCGRAIREVYVVSVENTELRVCSSCARGKKVLHREVERDDSAVQSKSVRKVKVKEEDKELVEGYGGIIRRAREGMGIPHKVLAEMISEKETYLVRVEEEKTKPSMELTRKLEKALNIKLTQPRAEERPVGGKASKGGATLGDFVGP